MRLIKYICILCLTSSLVYSAVPKFGILIETVGTVTYVLNGNLEVKSTNKIVLDIDAYEEYLLTPSYDGVSNPVIRIGNEGNPLFIHRLYNLSNLGRKKLSLQITAKEPLVSELPSNIITKNNEVIVVIKTTESDGIAYIEVDEGEEGLEFYYNPTIINPLEGKKYSYEIRILEDPTNKIYVDSYIIDNSGDVVNSYIDIVEYTEEPSKIKTQDTVYDISPKQKAFALVSLGSLNEKNNNLDYNLDFGEIFDVEKDEILVSNSNGENWVRKESTSDPNKDIKVEATDNNINITTSNEGAIPKKEEGGSSALFGMPVIFALPLENMSSTEKKVSFRGSFEYESLPNNKVIDLTNNIPIKAKANNFSIEFTQSLDGVNYSTDVLTLEEGKGIIYYQIKLYSLGEESIEEVNLVTSTPKNTSYIYGEYEGKFIKEAYYQVDDGEETLITNRLGNNYKGMIRQTFYNVNPNSVITLRYSVEINIEEEE